MPDTERGTYPIHLPQELCDGLAARADTLPRHMWFRIHVFLNFAEGRTAKIGERFLNWREHNTLEGEKLDDWLAKQGLNREEFRRQFAPGLAFLEEASKLLLAQPPQEELDAGFRGAAERYLATPSPRSEQERLKCVVENRSKSCPNWLELFLIILPRSDLHITTDQGVITQQTVISERGARALKIAELCTPETKEILEESYALELELVKDCMAVIGLEQEDFIRRVRELLRAYAAVRVERKRRLWWDTVQ